MARRKNASFVGCPTPDVARDASIYSRWIDNAAGDFALIFDKITGENGEANTINHSGAINGRGCPLRLPAGSQTIARELRLVGAAVEADFYIFVIPVFFPATGASESWTLELDINLRIANQKFECEVFSTSWALSAGPYVGQRVVEETAIGERYRRVVFDLTVNQTGAAGAWRYVAVRCPMVLDDLDPSAWFEGWRLFPSWRSNGQAAGLIANGSTVVSNPYPSVAMTPAAMSADYIDAAMTASDAPLDPWVLTRLNRGIGTVWEYLTGSPQPNANATTVSQARDHNRSSFLTEPLLEFPICSVALGCMRVSSVTAKTDFLGTLATTSPVEGPIDWVRYPQTTAANEVAVVSRSTAYFPPFSTTATTDLDFVVLGLDYSTGGAGTWQARITTTGGVGAWVNFSQLSTTNLWAATITGVPFTASALNSITVEVRNTAGGAISGRELLLLGWSAAFAP